MEVYILIFAVVLSFGVGVNMLILPSPPSRRCLCGWRDFTAALYLVQ